MRLHIDSCFVLGMWVDGLYEIRAKISKAFVGRDCAIFRLRVGYNFAFATLVLALFWASGIGWAKLCKSEMKKAFVGWVC